MSGSAKRARAQLVAYLAREGSAEFAAFAVPGQLILTAENGKRHVTTEMVLKAGVSDGLLQRLGEKIQLTSEGKSASRRLANTGDAAFAAQHRNLLNSEIRLRDGTRHIVQKNANESPLSRLKALAAKDGRPWISDAGFEAGERLRRDFDKGHLRQRVTASWDMGGAKRGKGERGGLADLSDSAIDSRQRLNAALESLGPDLGGVLTDVCCHLKGLEAVERERRWPPRSAKLMLRTGLDLLARYYGTEPGKKN